MCKPAPSFITGVECRILAGGAHHTTLSYETNAGVLRDLTRIMGIEFVSINKDTEIFALEKELMLGDVIWK